jgi:hypothetical protein
LLTTFHQGIDVALRRGFVQPVLRNQLGNKIVLVLERREFVLGELAPLGADVIENDLLVVVRVRGRRTYF